MSLQNGSLFDINRDVVCVLVIRSHVISGHQVEVKKAMERDQKNGGSDRGGMY